MKIKVNSLEDTKALASKFVNALDNEGLFVTLTGDIGAGKTQFIRYILQILGTDKKVTSPSFVILNEYKTSKFPVYHFDLYRLEEKGLKSIVSELREYSKTGYLTFIEWAEFGKDEIPSDAFKINIEYDEDNLDIRWFEFTPNKNTQNFYQRFYKEINKWIYLPYARL